MKITKDDKKKFFELLDTGLEKVGAEKLAAHKALELGKDKAKRLRWDLFYASRVRIGDGVGIDGDVNLYAYMNDSHIDTVLKAYVLERGL